MTSESARDAEAQESTASACSPDGSSQIDTSVTIVDMWAFFFWNSKKRSSKVSD